MSTLTYTAIELRRSLRNRRFLFLSLAFPLVMYVLLVTANRTDDFSGTHISSALFYLSGLASFGTMSAMLGNGGRISAERQVGWNRQLRLTPLAPGAYLRTKIATGYLVALLTVLLLVAVGLVLGARLPVGRWVELVGLVLVGLIPFAGLGIGLGHLVRPDSMGPIIGGVVGLLAFVSGVWYPIPAGTFRDVVQLLPSYWIAQASHVAVGGSAWSVTGWVVVGVWSVAMAAFAAQAYRRDTRRA